MLTQEQVEMIFGPHEAVVLECIEAGVRYYTDKYPEEIRVEHTARTRSSARHDHMVASLKRAFDGSPDAKVVENGNLVVLAINGVLDDGTIGTAALRFNKWDSGGPHSNDTAQTSLFNGQQPLQAQDGAVQIPDHATYLWVGYELNAIGTAAKSVSVSCRLNDVVLWERPIAAAEPLPIANLAERRSEEQPERRPGQVRGRGTDVAQGGEDDADG
jgi:hypothetical protein